MQAEQFGPYRIEATLGSRGPAELLRAVDPDQDRAVALAVLPVALSADPAYRARFDRDAALAAALDVPHAARARRHGEVDGRLYLESALPPGRDLAAVLAEEGPLDPARAVRLVGQVAGALDAASAAGLVHGGLTPADVVVADSGEDSACLTGLGVPRTTPVDGPADPRVDVAGLAGVLAACLTGSDPAAEPPGRLGSVVRTGLAEDPDHRFATCGELAAAARAALADDGPGSAAHSGAGATATGGGSRPARRPLLLGGLAALAALAVLALVLVLVLSGGSGDDPQAGAAPTTRPAAPATTTAATPEDDAAQEQLRAIIPGDWIAVDCDPGADPGDGAIAALGCGASGGQPGPEDSVFYLYQDAATAADVFVADMRRNGVAPLADGDACPAAQGFGPYEDDDHDHTGFLACWITDGNDAVLAWTQDDVGAEAVVTVIDGGQLGLDALYAWWAYPDTDVSGFVRR